MKVSCYWFALLHWVHMLWFVVSKAMHPVACNNVLYTNYKTGVVPIRRKFDDKKALN